MASKGKITEIADIQAIQKQIDTINTGLGSVVISLEKVVSSSLKVNDSFSNSTGIKDLTEAQKNLSKEQREAEIHAQKLAKEAANREKAELLLQNAIDKSKTATNQQTSAYKSLSDSLNANRKAWKDLAATNQENTTQGKALLETIKKQDTELKKIDATVGQHQRNVGNYKNAILEAINALKDENNELKKEQKTLQESQKGLKKNSDEYKKNAVAIIQNKSAIENNNKEIKSNQILLGSGTNAIEQYGGKFGSLIKQSQDFTVANGGLKGSLQAGGQAVAGFGKQLLTLLANPIVLIIGGIAAAVMLLVKAMNSNGEATEKMNQVLAPFKAILGAVFNVLGKVVGTFLDGVLAVQKFATAIISIIPGMVGVAVATNKQIQLEKERQKLAEEERADIVSDSKDRLRVAELKKELARSDKYTAEQRIAMAREIDKIEKANMLDDVNRQIRRHNLLIAQMKSEGKTYKDLTEDQKQAFRESQAKINDLRADYLDKTKKVGAKEAALTEEIESEKQKKREESEKKREESEKKREESEKKREELNKKRIEDEKKLRDIRVSLIQDETERELQTLFNKYDDDYKANKGNKAIQLALNEKYAQDVEKINKKVADDKKAADQKIKDDAAKNADILWEEYETFTNQQNEIDLEKKKKQEAAKLEIDKKAAEKRKEIYEASSQAVMDIFNGIVGLQNAAYETDLQKLDDKAKQDEEAKEKELKAAGNNAELKEKINEKYEAKEKEREKERRKIELEKAKFQKQAAIFGIILDTAKAIANHLTRPWLIPFDILTGGIQLAVAAAQPLPKYKHGRKGGKAELAIVGEAGQEAIRLKSGETYLTPNKETRMFLPDGASVIPNHELMKNLSYKDLPASIRNEKQSFSDLIPFLSNISDTVKNKKETHLNITESGFYTIVKNGSSQTTYVNNKFKN